MTLVLGGARSGKSRYAEQVVMASPSPWVYVATAEPFDDEMTARIAEHRSRRGGQWQTVEAPLDLAGAIADAPAAATVLVDCLTLWLNNLMFKNRDIDAETQRLEAALAARQAPDGSGLQRSRLRYRAGQCGGAALSRSARPAQSADRRARRSRRPARRRTADVCEGPAMSKTVDETEAERHRAKMAKRKAVQDAEVADKKIEKGLLIVHTGTGKGKSTAAFGLALRMLGRGKRVGVVQFIKGAWQSAERDALETFGDLVIWHTMGEGFTWDTQDLKRDIAAAERAWAKARELMADPDAGVADSRRTQYRAALRLSRPAIGGRRTFGAPARPAHRHHRPQRQA